MPSSQEHNTTAFAQKPVDYLLISAPNAEISRQIERRLQAAGVSTAEWEAAVRADCSGRDWRSLLESIAAGLLPSDQLDTRVALLSNGDGIAEIRRAVFRSHSLSELLVRARQAWLSQVLAEDRLVVHFQPLLQYPPGRVHGYECLVRGIAPDGALIMPLRLFDAARSLGLLPQLDEACAAAAIRAASAVGQENLTFFVNVMPNALSDPRRSIVATMQRVEQAGLHPGQIAFEIVETEQITDQRHLLNILGFYRKAGLKVALDDVGAGYASLLSLSRLRPDYVKLDGELVRRASESAMEAKIVADLAETARQNGIIPIAEGIETAEQLRLVLDCGIRILQGYYLARPGPSPLHPAQVAELSRRIRSAAGRRSLVRTPAP